MAFIWVCGLFCFSWQGTLRYSSRWEKTLYFWNIPFVNKQCNSSVGCWANWDNTCENKPWKGSRQYNYLFTVSLQQFFPNWTINSSVWEEGDFSYRSNNVQYKMNLFRKTVSFSPTTFCMLPYKTSFFFFLLFQGCTCGIWKFPG